MEILLLLVLSVVAVCLLVAVMVQFFRSPYKYPYHYTYFDVSKKRNVKILNYIDERLKQNGLSEYTRAYENIEKWKKNCLEKAEKSPFKKLRKKQFYQCIDDKSAFKFICTREQTRYKQINYQKYPYKVKVPCNRFEANYDFLKNRLKQLEGIETSEKSVKRTLKFQHSQKNKTKKANNSKGSFNFRMGGWFWYLSGQESILDKHKCGKWMYFFNDQELAMNICEKAIKEKICYECKCTDLETQMTPTGVICFYQNGDDIDNHKRIINFLLNNNMIRKTKTGKLYNISFKFDDQTRAGEYGADFEGKIKLSQFVDLNTGEWIV